MTVITRNVTLTGQCQSKTHQWPQGAVKHQPSVHHTDEHLALPAIFCWMTGEAITGCHKQDFYSLAIKSSLIDLGQLA